MIKWIKLWALDKFFLRALVEKCTDTDCFNFGRLLGKYIVDGAGKRGQEWVGILVSRLEQMAKGLGSVVRPK